MEIHACLSNALIQIEVSKLAITQVLEKSTHYQIPAVQELGKVEMSEWLESSISFKIETQVEFSFMPCNELSPIHKATRDEPFRPACIGCDVHLI